ncbi:MAG TPA: aldehyde dehydrogenase (NADP(+)) [Candidatus Dormibacteraeota bacterium]|nr:aldehyde dehydrogenase (NADP(+)) [Candidatus Dormibacteraeota bacterium]
MKLTGEMLIGKSAVRGHESTLRAVNPALGTELQPSFGGGGFSEVDHACSLAQEAFDPYRETGLELRARFLETIAQGIIGLGETLVERACAETGLPKARIEGERARTVGQLRLFASIVRDGRWLDATLDSPLPDRTPQPRPDLRLRKIPLGPVAVFGASNFPLAFSVAGGDTASALAAGCPVVVKAHPAHLGTSELVGRVIQEAVATCALHEGVFSLLVGEGNAIGEALVSHSAIQAVGFTGSRQGGVALMKLAANRPVPIPVYAEMSSINPMFFLPRALSSRGEKLAQGFVDSMTLGVGQFCTNPGLAIALENPDWERFRSAAAEKISAKAVGTMLTPGIEVAYRSGLQRLATTKGVHTLAEGQPGSGTCVGRAALLSTDAKQFLAVPHMQDEVFGPASLLVSCRNIDEMVALAEQLSGQLTASLHLETEDVAVARRLLPVLERKVGRIIVNGFPTGVEVSYAMVHGGPYPATSDSRSTSVGATAIERFLRPICYQDVPESLLPVSLQDANPLSLWRLQDGKPAQR